MQKLQLESSWDKTLSPRDRDEIEQAFSRVTLSGADIQFTPLWQAMNHKGQLLVTVLVHNTRKEGFTFTNSKLHYKENGVTAAKHTFTIPALCIGAETTMPWTFIFPVESLTVSPTLESGFLEFFN
ncbi:SLAP domain-containing protein [Salirhabdus euzebyi]|uniref:SLAP domain-containing protein n=1 Tax=Salirhabdus euzebyi TaxID=394506 RepID=A0A841Q432_9BACI|nr:SLAP domain-containing protein [Salirhabdus euzebyi]MBB6453166.1 SLAP domain-containing protein [Salirhabdus euzebyi]